MGLHHFHLGLTREAKGHAARTNEVLFASVTRDTFEIIGLFDHDAFERKDDGTMTSERMRLWSTYDARQAANTLPGQLSVGGFNGLGITMSSHPVAVVQATQAHARIIRKVEPTLDDPEYVRSLYPADNILRNRNSGGATTILTLASTTKRQAFLGSFAKVRTSLKGPTNLTGRKGSASPQGSSCPKWLSATPSPALRRIACLTTSLDPFTKDSFSL